MINGFLAKDAAPFAKTLWKLLLSAQNNAQGVPQELLDAKKAELEQERVSIIGRYLTASQTDASCRSKIRKSAKKP